jgi:hypothetical protein
MLFHPICGSGSCPSRSASRPARLRNEHDRFGHVRIEGEIPMFDYEKSSGVDITSKENYFFYPPRRLQGGKSRKNPCFFCPPAPNGFGSFRLAVATGVLLKSSSNLQGHNAMAHLNI